MPGSEAQADASGVGNGNFPGRLVSTTADESAPI